MKKVLKKATVYVASVAGAVGTGLQNYMAVATLIKDIINGGFALTKAGMGIIHGAALALGGLCSGLVNLCINIELLESFMERITQKPRPKLKGWQRFRYWFGSGVFIGTGILFGLTAFAFGPIGPLAALSIAAGIFVAGIMTIQELETWLESFDNPEGKKKKSLKEIFKEWKKSLTKSKAVGIIIAIGNVVALSLLFTMALGSFLIGVGVPALPALIAGFTVAFTGGAFTEFYFYNRFLSNFCDKIKENWKKFWQTKFPVVGLICAAANALVNAALSYVGIVMITGLLTAASIAVPPIGIVIAVAVTAAAFAGLASFILGMDFWIRNSAKLINYFKKSKPSDESPAAPDHSKGNTKTIMTNLPEISKPKLDVDTQKQEQEKQTEIKNKEELKKQKEIQGEEKSGALVDFQFSIYKNPKMLPQNQAFVDDHFVESAEPFINAVGCEM